MDARLVPFPSLFLVLLGGVAALAVAVLVPAQALGAQARGAGPRKLSPGKLTTGQLHGKRERVLSLTGKAPPRRAQPSSPFAIPLRTRDPRALAAGKAAAARRAERLGSYAPSRGPRTSVQPDGSASGFSNWAGLGPTGSSPSDSNGSISPTYYLEAVNNQVGAYARSDHALLSSASLATLTAGTDPCDPVVMWDQQQQRWFYTAIRCDGTATANQLYLGWSKTADPTDFSAGWCKFTLNTTTTLRDYPKLGDNEEHIAIGTNNFAGNSYTGSTVLFAEKPPSGDTTCANPPAFTFSGFGDTPVPANMFDDGAKGFVVSAPFPGGGPENTLDSVEYSGGGGGAAPTVTALASTTVTAYTFPANAPQPATLNLLDTLDARLTTAVGGADPDVGGNPAVWTQHTVDGPGGRSQVTWYELTYAPGSPSTPSLHQEGRQRSGDQFYFNGAISPTTLGNEAVLHYNASGPTAPQYPQVRAVSRFADDPLGEMQGEKSLFTSNHSSADFTCSPCRWGDYAGASPDPSNSRAVWGTSMVLPTATGTQPDWSTRNFGLSTSSVSVSSSAGVLSVDADPGQVNKLVIDRLDAATIAVSEFSWPTLRLSGGCTLLFSSKASCATASTINVDAGDRNDVVTGSNSDGDTLTGGSGVDRLFGRGGNDTLNAADGEIDATIDCGAGTADVANIDAGEVTVNCETVNVVPQVKVVPQA